MKPVYLFDIDGTLMRRTGPFHGDALINAVREVLHVETNLDGIPVHGMLDRDILFDMLSRAGQPSSRIEEGLPAIMRLAQDLYKERCPDLRSKVLPGVPEVLEQIAATGFPTGLVTGNLTDIGWTKVERAGLARYFQFGAFADMGTTRAALGRIAYDLAGGTHPELTTVIGDAPSDIQAAKANGFRSVAVATGVSPREELALLEPDLLLNDLSTLESRSRLIGDSIAHLRSDSTL